MLLSTITCCSQEFRLFDANTDWEVNRGSGRAYFNYKMDDNNFVIPIYYYIPEDGDLKNMPIQFVMHGMNRNAAVYRDSWLDKARYYGVIVLVPEFDEKQFPSAAYQRGNVMDSHGNYNYVEDYTYNIIDAIFLTFLQSSKSVQTQFNMYGHSAGAQFTHRYVLFNQSPYLNIAVAANAGYYTFPDPKITFPHGIKDAKRYNSISKNYFQKKLVIVVGTADVERGGSLNTSEKSDAQGLNRYERGLNFYNFSKQRAKSERKEFCWKLFENEGVAHSNSKMATFAADLLYSDNPAY